VHPPAAIPQRGIRDCPAGLTLLHELGERDRRGVAELGQLMPSQHIVSVPLAAEPPAGLAELEELGTHLADALGQAWPPCRTAAS
jgi:hypothetical protein